jgi:uncharacterized membrane protein HdeD (DUF308 family)
MPRTISAPHGWAALLFGFLFAGLGIFEILQSTGATDASDTVLLILGTILILAGLVVIGIDDYGARR